MKFHELCETCVNIDVNSTVYIHNKLTNETRNVCKVKDLLGQHANDTIKWFYMLFKDLYSACSNLKTGMIVEVTKGTFTERVTAKACLEKYGMNQVVCFGMYGVKLQIMTVILK